jgi:triosephosphate isomerase (TIM)
MNKERKLIIAGNWKMNKTVAEALDLVRGLKIELANVKEVDIVVCPPFTALCEVSKAILETKNIRLGAQNMSENNMGAHTGEIAAGMLKEFSVRYVILGHSERRQYQKESDALIAKKADRVRWRNAGRTRRQPDGAGPGHAGSRQFGRFDEGANGGNHCGL